jgi:hypothetical protein
MIYEGHVHGCHALSWTGRQVICYGYISDLAEVVHHDLLALTDLVAGDASASESFADPDQKAVDQDQTKLYRREIGTIWFTSVV